MADIIISKVYRPQNTNSIAGTSNAIFAGGAAAATSFLALTDTPSSYSGLTGKYVRVNTGETGLEIAGLYLSGVTDVGIDTGALVAYPASGTTYLAWNGTNWGNRPVSLNQLAGIGDITDPANNEFLMHYNGKWQRGELTAGANISLTKSGTGIAIAAAGSVTNLVDLGDVDADNPEEGQLLMYKSGTTKWTKYFLTPSDIPATNFLALTDTPNTYTGKFHKFLRVNTGETGLEFSGIYLSGLTDAGIDTGALVAYPLSGTTYLAWNGTNWGNRPVSLNQLAGIGDIDDPANNEFLMHYNGKWQRGELTAGANIALTKSATGIAITAAGSVNNLADLNDVDSDSPEEGQLLMYKSGTTKWTKYFLTPSDIPSHTHSTADITNGTLATARGGTNQTSWTANRLTYSNSSTQLSSLAAITANRALISNASGLPTHSTVTNTELGYLAGVTSGIQAQLNNKANSAHTHPVSDLTQSSFTNNDLIMWYGSGFTQGRLSGSGIINVTATVDGYTISAAAANNTLAGLNDVDVDTASNNQYLKYNSSLSLWVNSTIDAGEIGSGTLAVTRGGTNQTSWTANRLTYSNSTTQLSSLAAITANRALASDANGLPVASTTTATELGYVAGATSSIQTQLNGKQATITGGATSIVSSNLTASRALVSDGSGKVAASTVTSTELGYLAGVTSGIQAQINGKANAAHTHSVSDLTQSTYTNNDFIMWYGTGWIKARLSGAGSANVTATADGYTISVPAAGNTLAGLTDVDVDTASNNQYLKYNSSLSLWVNSTIDAGEIGSGSLATARGGTNQTSWTANRLTYSNSTTQLSSLAAITASRALASDANGLPVASTTTATELGYVAGATSSIQTQLNGKQATITGGATSIVSSNLTASRALVSDVSGKVAASTVTSTEVGYLAGVTSGIQAQINGKANAAHTHPLSDLTQSSASNNMFPMWYTSSWIAGELTAGAGVTLTKSATGIQISASGSGSSTLAGLNDVDVDTASNNQYLKYDSSLLLWINSTIDAGHIGSGTLATARGGTNQTSWTANRLTYSNSTTQLSSLAAITANRALISNASGLPTHATTTATEIGYVNGVTSAIQTQLDGKQPKTVTVQEKTGNYTLQASDNGTVIVFNSSSNYTLTVPTAFGTAGYSVGIIRRGTGTVTIAQSSTTILPGNNYKIGTSGAASLVCIASNVFHLSGNVAP